MKHGLRDLAELIERTAREHPYYGQGCVIVQNCTDHLCAVAALYELDRKAVEKDK